MPTKPALAKTKTEGRADVQESKYKLKADPKYSNMQGLKDLNKRTAGFDGSMHATKDQWLLDAKETDRDIKHIVNKRDI